MFRLNLASALPAPLHRAGLRLAHYLRTVWWRWRKPLLTGCSVMLFDPDGAVLLVRHSYGHRRWGLPGGAVGKGEAAEDAVRRELLEEVGCRIDDLVLVGATVRNLHGARNRIEMFRGKTADSAVPDDREIAAAGFFRLDDLPQPLSEGALEWLPRL